MATAVAQLTLAAEDLAQIRGLTDEWVRVSLARDWDGLLALLTDDFVFLPPDVPIVAGKEAMRAYLEAFPRMTKFSATVVVVEGQPELAWARGTFSITAETAPGTTTSMVGKFGATYRKRLDGRWLCASDTWNLDAPPST